MMYIDEARKSTGRPAATRKDLDERIKKLVFKHRGSIKVTVALVRKKLVAARKVGKRTLQRRLCEAGLAWLRRRRKHLVPEVHKRARRLFAQWVLSRRQPTLSRWVYSDGAAFYLARTPAEHESKKRAALGPFVWRMADGSDGMYEECIGPSAYWKAQGICVRVR